MEYRIRVEPDVKIYVNDINPYGRKTILFIHGWPANHKMFEYQFNQLPRIGYRCIGIDMRGFGNSDKPWGSYDYNRLADDVRYVVEALKLQDFTLAGHSLICFVILGKHFSIKKYRSLYLIGSFS